MHYTALFILLRSFFFTATTTTEIYTLSLHDALPISRAARAAGRGGPVHVRFTLLPGRPLPAVRRGRVRRHERRRAVGRAIADRKSTRLNSSHSQISYAVFCLKKKKKE